MSAATSAAALVINAFSASTVGSASVDVIAVYDQNNNQLFPDARAIKASVKEGAKLPEHPIETGYTITDNRVIQPIEISLAVILTPHSYYDTYIQIKQAFLGVTSIVVNTRTGVYPNLFIQDMPHEETSDMFDTVSMILQLKEVLIVQAQSTKFTPAQVKTRSSTSTVSTGTQQGTTASQSQEGQTRSSVAYKGLNYLQSL
jgi:hypothetical protein